MEQTIQEMNNEYVKNKKRGGKLIKWFILISVAAIYLASNFIDEIGSIKQKDYRFFSSANIAYGEVNTVQIYLCSEGKKQQLSYVVHGEGISCQWIKDDAFLYDEMYECTKSGLKIYCDSDCSGSVIVKNNVNVMDQIVITVYNSGD